MKNRFPRTVVLPLKVGRLLSALLLLATLGAALAHAHLHVSSPAEKTVVTQAPTVLELEFTEVVEAPFSHFELVRLGDALQADAYAEDGAAWQALDAAAADLSEQLVAAPDQAPDGAVELSLGAGSAGTQVQLQVVGALTPGDYMLFFNVLSVDTHSSSGYLVFSYQPQQ